MREVNVGGGRRLETDGSEDEGPAPEPLREDVDFYREGSAIVFTAHYHLRRGYCCGSGCRHCPYGESARAEVEW